MPLSEATRCDSPESTTPRVAAMRERVLRDKRERQAKNLGRGGAYGSENGGVVMARSLRASENEPSWQRRRARVTRDQMRSWTFLLDSDEQIVGRIVPREPYSEEEIEAAAEYLRPFGVGGMRGHCELDMTRVMAGGVDGLRADIAARLQSADGERADTYASFLDVLEGLSEMLLHMADVAEEKMAEASPGRAAELREMAEACRHVAHRPPETMRQALQLHWAIWLGVTCGDGSSCIGTGHIDRWLYPVYERDCRENGLTDDAALFLLENLYLLINACWTDGSALPVMAGGRDASGRDVTNRLSYLSFEALRRTALCYPTVGLVWHEGTPEALVDFATELVSQGYSTPAFFGEEVIRQGLISHGATEADAACFMNSTCVEITPSGASNIWVASPYFSVCRHLLEEIDAQASAPEPAADFAAFLEAYFARMDREIAKAVEQINANRAARQARRRFPLQSVFTRDCIARGRDIDDGGAVYNWDECSFVGLANLADALYVIEQEVYVSRRRTLAEMKALCESDFAGHEETRRRFLDEYPKYGQDDGRVDGLFARVLERFRETCAGHRIAPDDSPFVPGAFCFVMHERMGRECAATPDGRRAGTPFADGCGPAQGRETEGPTAAILSTTSWDHRPMIGGLAYNMKFNGSLFDSPGSVRRLRDLVVTYLRRGGFETQVNVVDHEILRKARENPDDYRDLVVRIGGYTDYFTRLDPKMQDEVMARTEFTRI